MSKRLWKIIVALSRAGVPAGVIQSPVGIDLYVYYMDRNSGDNVQPVQ